MTTKRTDPKPAKPRVPVRERLLATAGDLFYNEGIHAVGIDRVLAEAGVAKASLYDSFGSKEALVAAYLSSRQEARVERVQGIVDAAPDARAALLGIFASIGAQITAPAYRGCAFAKAGIEAEPGSQVRAVCDDARQWMLDLFGRLARQAGAAEPDALARQHGAGRAPGPRVRPAARDRRRGARHGRAAARPPPARASVKQGRVRPALPVSVSINGWTASTSKYCTPAPPGCAPACAANT